MIILLHMTILSLLNVDLIHNDTPLVFNFGRF